MARASLTGAALVASALAGHVRAEPTPRDGVLVDAVEVRGARRTRKATITALLPRKPPAVFLRRELDEFERRLNNLGIFDRVLVSLESRALVVEVREKWTLIPTIDFATGQTLADTYVAVGATDHNFLGTASALTLNVSYEDRGLNGYVGWQGHPYDPSIGAPLLNAFYGSSGVSFDSGQEWRRHQAGGSFGWLLPYSYGLPLRVSAALFGHVERISERLGQPIPSSGVAFGSELEVAWDSYTWHDLAPYGYALSIGVSAGAFVPAAQARHSLGVHGLFAVAPTTTTALMAQVTAEVVSSGNPNHSLLLSSWQEVRGLTDSFYRDQAQLTGNVELRQAARFAERWAVQAVAFADAAVFTPFDVTGTAQAAQTAFGAGVGLRLIPTLLAQVVPRIDVGRLFAPDRRWFFQLGLAQYF